MRYEELRVGIFNAIESLVKHHVSEAVFEAESSKYDRDTFPPVRLFGLLSLIQHSYPLRYGQCCDLLLTIKGTKPDIADSVIEIDALEQTLKAMVFFTCFSIMGEYKMDPDVNYDHLRETSSYALRFFNGILEAFYNLNRSVLYKELATLLGLQTSTIPDPNERIKMYEKLNTFFHHRIYNNGDSKKGLRNNLETDENPFLSSSRIQMSIVSLEERINSLRASAPSVAPAISAAEATRQSVAAAH